MRKGMQNAATMSTKNKDNPKSISLPTTISLKIGVVNGPLEREADLMADRIMRMPEPTIQRKCSTCEEKDKVQRKPLASQITPFAQRKSNHGNGHI